MNSQIFPIPAFTDNYIWALHESGSNKLAVVDPGDAAPVIDYAESRQLTLSTILITHHHADHTGGLKELIARYQPHVIGPEPSGISGIDQFVHEGDSFELFGQQWLVMEVPGHTLDHIAYYSESSRPGTLFCGDTLFAAGCGRIFEGNPKMMASSLSKLASLPEDTEVYCTHEYTMANLKFAAAVETGNELLQQRIATEQARRDSQQPTLPSTIRKELETNPFLRCDQQSVITSVSEHCGESFPGTVETFAALRSWKDNF